MPPAPPPHLCEFPAADRIGAVVDLIRRQRDGEFHGPAYFGAEAAWELLLRSLVPLGEMELCKLLVAIGAVGDHACGYPWRFAWEQSQKLIKRLGISPDLAAALRAMTTAMHVHGSDKNAAVAIDRALFFERFSDIDLECNAADVIRRDLRGMLASAVAGWDKLLALGMAVNRAEPHPAWFQGPEALGAGRGCAHARGRGSGSRRSRRSRRFG